MLDFNTQIIFNAIKLNRKRDLALQLHDNLYNHIKPFNITREQCVKIRENYGSLGVRGRIFHQALEQYLRNRIEPVQAMFSSWMQGAKAQVKGEDVPFSQVIIWCQDQSDNEKRHILRYEIRSLCRFLAPFSHATWQVLLHTLEEEFNYPNYIEYCQEKKAVDIKAWYKIARQFLDKTKDYYNELIEEILGRITSLTIEQACRFDAIYLLGLRYLDHLFPVCNISDSINSFFTNLGVDLNSFKNLIIHTTGKSGRQSYCIPIEIPNEVHVIIGPIKGWLDLESFFHEIGHALSFIFTSKDLSLEEREFFISGALSETFAFCFQKICMSEEFLVDIFGLSLKEAKFISKIHAFKWLALTRRYATKFLVEVDNFLDSKVQRGQEHYAKMMKKETGFDYDPETYLFDLMPDIYSLDYFQAYIASSCIWKYFIDALGTRWFCQQEALNLFFKWWQLGNSLGLEDFFKKEIEIPLTIEPFLEECKELINLKALLLSSWPF